MKRLLDDLNGAFWTLHLACSADEAFIIVYNNRFFVSDFEDFDRACVDACSASSAFFDVNFNFYHGTANSTFRF